MKRYCLILMASLFTLSACNVPPPYVTVVVYPSTQRCTVMMNGQEQPVECRDLVKHLRDVLKIGADRQIFVSLPGVETVSKEDRSIDDIAEFIRKAGYRNVTTARFGL